MARYSKSDRESAIARLHEILKPGDTVHCILRHVSRSGMSRRIDLYKLENGEPRFLTGYAAKALGMPWKDDGIVIGGCGMDMGFALVSELSAALFPGGFECIGEDRENRRYCPSNDHSNGDRDYTPHLHKSGDYAISHRWM